MDWQHVMAWNASTLRGLPPKLCREAAEWDMPIGTCKGGQDIKQFQLASTATLEFFEEQ